MVDSSQGQPREALAAFPASGQTLLPKAGGSGLVQCPATADDERKSWKLAADGRLHSALFFSLKKARNNSSQQDCAIDTLQTRRPYVTAVKASCPGLGIIFIADAARVLLDSLGWHVIALDIFET